VDVSVRPRNEVILDNLRRMVRAALEMLEGESVELKRQAVEVAVRRALDEREGA